jgi:hypothetical protein
MKNRNIILTTILFALASLALPQGTQAVSPAPDGGYSGANTAEGQNALLVLTTGTYNTAIGWFSLRSNTDASFNTALGGGALLANTAEANTATGAGALLSNTIGSFNTADGVFTLFSNSSGFDNTAIGDEALLNNTTGISNTAIGGEALLENGQGSTNTAVGRDALDGNTTGNNNTAIGALAGQNLTTGDNNIDIGYNVVGVPGESNTIRIGNTDITDTFIRGISGATTAGGVAVFVNSNGHLGTTTSSARFKDEIKPMGNTSEAILALRPVSFRYKKEIDPQGIPEFGLIAEEVEKVNPALVIRDPEGRPYTVRYEQINAMLLNEFLKEHHKVETQQATIAELKSSVETRELIANAQQKQIEMLTAQLKEQAAQIQKVSAQVEISKPAPQMVCLPAIVRPLPDEGGNNP